MLNRIFLPLLVGPLALACAGERPDDLPKDPNGSIIQARADLRTAFDGADMDIIGVTFDPDTGDRFVLDKSAGLYQLVNGVAVMVASQAQLRSEDAIPQSVFTDVVALGDGQFALTALNDGFMFDTKTGAFSRYFCYVPGSIIDEFPMRVEQLTRSVTYDPATDKLFAQPQTFEEGLHDQPLRAEVGQFDRAGGEGYGWISIDDPAFSAGGIAIDSDGRMILGADATLYRLDLETQELGGAIDLSVHGIERIEALAVHGDRVLVVDGADDELVELKLR